MPSDIFMSCNRPKNCGSEYTHTTASEQNTKTIFYLTLIHLSISKGGGGASITLHFMFSSDPIHTCFAGSMKSMLDYFTHSGILKAYNKNQL